ncbi:MAG: sigma-54 dependent transcriptional regulator [Deltaproteobacteria bacterium]|nr:sigma-54 dependent transcriptional regulator [Deltaproteobacteria bacterium]
MTDRQFILLVDDEPDQCELYQATLERAGHDVRSTTSPKQALTMLDDVAVVITDLQMDEMSGLALCERVHAAAPDVAVIVLTGVGSIDSAVAALRVGAYDFLMKPVDPKLLLVAVGRSLERHKLRREVAVLRSTATLQGTAGLLGESPPMKKVHELIARIAPSAASVLIHGETGTGKELVARAIHDQSPRAAGPFVAINCAAVPPTLLETELFGHAKGSFTDAKVARQGLFVQASGGTLFLDEIGEMPQEMQAKLLRALQERTVRPVGANIEVPFDARILSATNKDLEGEVAEGRFRQDLFYRVNVVTIALPALHERGRDILVLAERFLRNAAERNGRPPPTVPSTVAERLLSYTWPGNVRELENCIERAVSLARFNELTIDDLPERVRNYRAETFVVAADDPSEILPLEELERRYIARVVRLLNGNKSRAAQLLGLDRRTLHRRLERSAEAAKQRDAT